MVRFLRTLRISLIRAFEHDALGHAKGAAFSSILTFFPALMLASSLMVMFDSTRAFSDELAREIGRLLPPGIGLAIRQYFEITHTRPGRVLVLASLVTLWTA